MKSLIARFWAVYNPPAKFLFLSPKFPPLSRFSASALKFQGLRLALTTQEHVSQQRRHRSMSRGASDHPLLQPVGLCLHTNTRCTRMLCAPDPLARHRSGGTCAQPSLGRDMEGDGGPGG